MKRLFIILFIFCSVKSYAKTIYVSTTGVDGGGGGTISAPYKTVYFASELAVSGDLVHVEAGVYNETGMISFVTGVNLEGEGQGITIINLSLSSSDYPIKFMSTDEGTPGNQTVKNITFTGTNLTSNHGIIILRRSNVSITHCTFKNFLGGAIDFYGFTTYGVAPTTFSSGNEFGFDSVINCSDRNYGGGMILMEGQDGLSIHDCYLNQTARPSTHNGDIVGGVGGWNKNFKFYNNVSIKPDNDGAQWNIHLEMWNTLGGYEIYNNNFTGGISLDLGGDVCIKGSSAFAWSIHDNTFQLSAQAPTGTGYTPLAVGMESYGSDVLIYNNKFINLAMPVSIQGNVDPGVPYKTISNVHVYNNLFLNSGYADGSYTECISIYATPNDTLRDIYIDNNTFYNSNSSTLAANVSFNEDSGGIIKNVNFRNNTCDGAGMAFMRVRTFPNIMDSIFSNTNVIFNCGNSNNIEYQSNIPTNINITNSIKNDPLLNGSYLPGTGSPALGSAMNVGLPTTNIGYYASPIVPASNSSFQIPAYIKFRN